MKLFAPATMLLLAGCAAIGTTDTEDPLVRSLYTVPSGAHRVVLGEWEFPGETGGLMGHYTTSIIKVRGAYVEIYDGDVLSGCCFWPQGIRLEQKRNGAYFNPVTEALYSINPDGSLTITKKDGAISIAARTPSDKSFSKDWK